MRQHHWYGSAGRLHLLGVEGLWVHIPKLLLPIPVDGAFKPEAIVLEEVGSPTMTRADEVQQALLTVKCFGILRRGAVIGEPRLSVAEQ
jgi:hypothetical protein